MLPDPATSAAIRSAASPVKPISAPFLPGQSPCLRTLTRPEDFKQALAQPWVAKTAHFALHHLLASPPRANDATRCDELSSAPAACQARTVDNSFENPVDKPLDKPLDKAPQATARADLAAPAPTAPHPPIREPASAAWAGYVVPKRHARRAVTRNLIRRQMRQVLINQQGADEGLPCGIWVLRLRQGFDRLLYPSAASEPLKTVVRDELARLLGLALQRHAQDKTRP